MAETPVVPENGRADEVGNDVYEDLTLTRYPEALDARGSNETGGNENLNLHKNLENYNMAEHVNALADAVMAIERALGIAPQIPTIPKDSNGNTIVDIPALQNLMKTKTVKARIDTIEDKNFDSRYGGPGWVAADGQHLVGHKHTGTTGHPTQISLTAEVNGLLPRDNINLDRNSATGLTGANISINASKNDSIDTVVADKLSQAQGGSIEKDLIVKGTSWTRWGRDYDVSNFTGDSETDAEAYGLVAYKDTIDYHKFIEGKFNDLYFGRYVIVVRAKTNTLVNGNLIKIGTFNPSGGGVESAIFKGTDFKAVNEWQNFYLVLDHNAKVTNKNGVFRVEKYSTTGKVKVSLDYVLITPVHPAIFDR